MFWSWRNPFCPDFCSRSPDGPELVFLGTFMVERTGSISEFLPYIKHIMYLKHSLIYIYYIHIIMYIIYIYIWFIYFNHGCVALSPRRTLVVPQAELHKPKMLASCAAGVAGWIGWQSMFYGRFSCICSHENPSFPWINEVYTLYIYMGLFTFDGIFMGFHGI